MLCLHISLSLLHNIWMGNKIPSTLQSYYSTAKFRPSIHISIILSMGALLDVCIAIFKACLALSSYILEFMLNIWIGNEILSVIQLYNSMRIFFFMNWVIIQSFRSRKFVERHFWINKPFFMYILGQKPFHLVRRFLYMDIMTKILGENLLWFLTAKEKPGLDQ